MYDTLIQEQHGTLSTKQNKLVLPPVFAFTRTREFLALDMDAWDKQIPCVLMQERPDWTKKPFIYWLRTLDAAVKNYGIAHPEWLTVVWAVLLVCPYLGVHKFTIPTDYDALKWVIYLVHTTRKLSRWRLWFLEFEFDVMHRAGIKI